MGEKFLEKLEPEKHSVFTKEKEELKEGKIFEDFKNKEEDIFKAGEGYLNSLSAEILFSKKARATAAFLTLFSASTAAAEMVFATESPPAEKSVQKKILSEEEMQEIKAPFDEKKIIKKIELAYEQKGYSFGPYSAESIKNAFNFQELSGTDFYRELSREKFLETGFTAFNSISKSKSSEQFFQSLHEASGKMDTEQKILFLQRLGHYFGKTYNFEMFADNEHVKISDDKMFAGLRQFFLEGKNIPTGICGNIHTFLVKSAENLGVEAWLQSGVSQNKAPHIWAGLMVEKNDKKEIAFLNYGDLILTGTSRYDEALGVSERYFNQIGLFNSYVGTKDEILFPVKSFAIKKLEEVVGYKPAEEKLSERLAAGKISAPESELKLKIGNETKEIAFSGEHLGLAFVNYQDIGNPYNSLDSLNAARGRLRFGDKEMELELNTTIMNLNIKDLGTGVLNQNEIANVLAFNYISSRDLTKKDYGRFVLNFGFTLEAGIRHIIGEGLMPKGGLGEAAVGSRLVFISPDEIGKVFIEAGGAFRGQGSNFQEQDLIAKFMSHQFKAGGSLKVKEGTFDLEAALAKSDASKKESVSAGFSPGGVKSKVFYEKEKSEFPRFIPDKEKIGVEAGYVFGSKPLGEINIYGVKTNEKYQNAEKRPSYEAGVLMKIFLW